MLAIQVRTDGLDDTYENLEHCFVANVLVHAGWTFRHTNMYIGLVHELATLLLSFSLQTWDEKVLFTSGPEDSAYYHCAGVATSEQVV